MVCKFFGILKVRGLLFGDAPTIKDFAPWTYLWGNSYTASTPDMLQQLPTIAAGISAVPWSPSRIGFHAPVRKPCRSPIAPLFSSQRPGKDAALRNLHVSRFLVVEPIQIIFFMQILYPKQSTYSYSIFETYLPMSRTKLPTNNRVQHVKILETIESPNKIVLMSRHMLVRNAALVGTMASSYKSESVASLSHSSCKWQQQRRYCMIFA